MNSTQVLIIIAVACEAGATFTGFANREPYWRGLLALGLVFYMIAVAIPK
jgi:hypothetical protein